MPSDAVAIDQQAVAVAQAAAPEEEMLRLVVEVFQSLADPTRARGSMRWCMARCVCETCL